MSTSFQKTFFWYSFFSVFARLVLYTSFSFYVFIAVLVKYRFIRNNVLKFRNFETRIFLALTLLSLWSLLYSVDFNNSLRPTINFVYWQVIGLVIFNNRHYIPWIKVFKGIFYGLNFTIFYHYLILPILPSQPILSTFGTNGFAFILISFVPISLLFISKRIPGYFYLFSIIYAIAALMSTSRAGFGIVTLEIIILIYVFNKKKLDFTFLIFTFLGILFVGLIRGQIVAVLNQINPEYGDLVSNDKFTEQDVSYLIRRAQIAKGLGLMEEHPYTGVGLMNFRYQPYEISNNSFKGAQLVKKARFMELETHNSYLTVIAELGIPCFVLFLILLIVTILKYIRSLNNEISPFLFVSLIGIIVHFYFINVIVNSFVWFALAIIIARVNVRLGTVHGIS